MENSYYYALLWTLQDEDTDFNGNKNKEIYELMKLAKAELRSNIADKEIFDWLGNKLVEVQIASSIQKNTLISISELEKVEEQKAGYSFPFYASLIDFELAPNQFQVLFDFGVILQHTDDVLDIYEDIHEATKTIANSLSINEFESFFNTKVELLIRQLKHQNVSKICIIHSLICISVGLVQIEYIKKLSNQELKVDYKNMERSLLICDFGKWGNLAIHFRITNQLFSRYKSNSKLFQ